MYLLNAIPGALVPPEGITITITPVTPAEVAAAAPASAIGHADTAAILTGIIGIPVPMARVSVPALAAGDVHFLALYQGPRLPEGATSLPEGATLGLYRLTAVAL